MSQDDGASIDPELAAILDEFGARSYGTCCAACQQTFHNCDQPYLTCHDALEDCLKNCADSWGTKLTPEQATRLADRLIEYDKRGHKS